MASALARRWKGRALSRWLLIACSLASVSCVPVTAERHLVHQPAPSTGLRVESPALPRIAGSGSTRPLDAPNTPPAPSTAFEGRTGLDRLRSLDCLAQAIYYEAASESEEGQRAVAQVVLNRVRHPAWPDSVCGVVYQGPMRAGGGCQFTFTCDGSLLRRPAGAAWAKARLIAGEALAGRSSAPVGFATHYHTHEVAPSWAPRLRPAAIIGAHRFYRLPGAVGEATAFTDRYTGSEPMVRPTFHLARATGAPPLPWTAAPPPPAIVPAAPEPLSLSEPAVAAPLSPSTVREEYHHSGEWRADAPAAITGRSPAG